MGILSADKFAKSTLRLLLSAEYLGVG